MRRLSLAGLVPAAAVLFFACTGDDPVEVVSGPDASTQTGSDAGSTTSSSGSVTDASGSTDAGPGPLVDAGPCNLAADFGKPSKITAASSLDLEQEPTLTENELTLYFARGGNVYSLSRASRDVDFDGSPKEVAEVDTDETLYWQSAAITRDGQTLLLGTKQLYLSTMSGGKFGTPVKVNASGDVSGEHPYVTFDQGAVYFNSAPGAAQSIKRATIISTTAWDNLTTFTELGTGNRFPVVSGDERTIYFASTRSDGGLGGDDVWVSKRGNKTDKWGDPTPLPGPINSDGNEAPSWLSSDGCRLYLMMSGKASINYDIYVASRPH